jgi:hypothetical protein
MARLASACVDPPRPGIPEKPHGKVMQMWVALHQVLDFVFLYGALPKAKAGFKFEALQIDGEAKSRFKFEAA